MYEERFSENHRLCHKYYTPIKKEDLQYLQENCGMTLLFVYKVAAIKLVYQVLNEVVCLLGAMRGTSKLFWFSNTTVEAFYNLELKQEIHLGFDLCNFLILRPIMGIIYKVRTKCWHSWFFKLEGLNLSNIKDHLDSQYKAFKRALLSESAGTHCEENKSLKIPRFVQPQLQKCRVSSHFNTNKVKVGK